METAHVLPPWGLVCVFHKHSSAHHELGVREHVSILDDCCEGGIVLLTSPWLFQFFVVFPRIDCILAVGCITCGFQSPSMYSCMPCDATR